MRITAHAASHEGRQRASNQDYALVDPELGLFVVCDGMGGHSAGEVASRTAAECLRSTVRQGLAQAPPDAPPDALAQILCHSVERASNAVYELASQDPGKRGMGTTCTAVLVRGDKAIMGHVGDSRLYLARRGQVHQLSEDHTFVAEAVRRGIMTPEQAAESAHGNVLTRAVGTQLGTQVDTLVFDLIPGDALLLCSDGLHQYISDPVELARLFTEGGASELPSRFVDLANERGGSDNITALVVRTPGPGEVREDESERASEVTANLDVLRRIELFRELPMADLVRVSGAFRQRDVEPTEVIIHEGESTESLFVLVRGAAEVLRGSQPIATLTSGAHFGEMALLSQRPRSATVRALEASRLLVLERPDFYGLLRQDPVLAVGILWRLAQTLSLRLDELYMVRDDSLPSEQGRPTMTYGIFPSPFDRR